MKPYSVTLKHVKRSRMTVAINGEPLARKDLRQGSGLENLGKFSIPICDLPKNSILNRALFKPNTFFPAQRVRPVANLTYPEIVFIDNPKPPTKCCTIM